jgi:hypothetical protein
MSPWAHERMSPSLRAYAWAAPCSVLGMCLALPMLVTGARVRPAQGVLEVAWHHGPALAKWPFVAITFGHVVLGRSHLELARLRVHEHAHVRQYERWGALFLVLYPASSLCQWVRGKRPYVDNVFEVDARACEQDQLNAMGASIDDKVHLN